MRLVRRRAALVWVAAAVLAAAAVTGTLLALGAGYGETVSGPSGQYPPALAASPGGMPRVVARLWGPVTLSGGLALTEIGGAARGGSPTASAASDGIDAVSLRTGHVYWSYRRPGHQVVTDAAAGGTGYVLWNDGLLAQIGLRTARIGWHQQLDTAAVDEAGIDNSGSQLLTALAAQGTLILASPREIDALSVATGKVDWTVHPAGGCAFGTQGVPVTGGVVVLDVVAPSGSGCRGGVRAYDVHTGRLRWRHPAQFSLIQPVITPGPGLVGAGDGGGFGVYDASTGRVERELTGFEDAYHAGSGLVLGDTGPGEGAGGGGGDFAAWDAATGRIAWRQVLPHSYAWASPPQFAGSGVIYQTAYTLGAKVDTSIGAGRQPTQQPWLLGYDPHTGHLVSRTRLPVVNPSLSGSSLANYQTSLAPVITGTTPGLVAVVETDAVTNDGPPLTYIAPPVSSADRLAPTLVLSG